jgi:hypothetical protein
MKTPSGASLDARRILAVAACVVLGVFFWSSPLLYPLKLLVVMMHESGHAIASLIVGGAVDRITIGADESGACLSRLPEGVLRQIIVYSSGYLGSAIAGGALLLASLRFGARRSVLMAACAWLLVMSVFYVRDVFTGAFCLGTAAAMAAGAKWLPDGAVDALNLFIASFAGLYAVFDLRDDLWRSASRGQSDASLLSDLTYVPAIVWAAAWTVAAIAFLGGAMWLAVRPARKAALRAARLSAARG